MQTATLQHTATSAAHSLPAYPPLAQETRTHVETACMCFHLNRLTRDYGWHIERRDIATGTNDGRIATISAYWMPQAAIAKAFEAGAREWIDSVKAARAERRKQSGKCKTDAAKIARRFFFS